MRLKIQIILFFVYIAIAFASEDEERLVRDLFRDYNKLIRPVQMINSTVEVLFSMSLIQLINVNEKNQVMTTNVWLNLRWKDYQLKWSEADYGSISVTRLPADKVWKPDIVLFNNLDGNFEVRYKSNVLIYSDGYIHWVPPAIYQSSCQIDVTYFPFDQQHCIMKFSSWTYNGNQVSLKFEKGGFVDLSDYWKSGSWDIVEAPASLNRYNNTRVGRPSETDITFHITIRRKTLFYTVNLILPTLLISFLCILVFYLPVDSGEKVTLGISILLSLVVFLLLVSKILPPTSLVLPLIAKYLLFTFIMNCISILVTVIIINCNFRSPRTHRMPTWTRIIFLNYLPMLLFLRRPKRTRLQWMRDMPSLSAAANQQQQNETMKSNSKEESKDCQSNNSQTFADKKNSVKRKDAKLIKQASTSSQQHSSSIEKQNTIDSPPPPPPKQPLQQLNIQTLPMVSNLMQQQHQQPFPMHNHFHTLAPHHHFHHPPAASSILTSHFHYPTCTITQQPEQLHHHLNKSQQAIPNLHTHYETDSSAAHLMRSLDNNLISPNFDTLSHLINSDLNATDALQTHSCLSPSILNETHLDHQNENLNHLNLHHHHHHHHNPHLDFSSSLHRNESNELNTTLQSVCTNEFNLNQTNNLTDLAQNNTTNQFNATANQANKQINQRQSSCDSSSSSSFYLSQAAFNATEALEFIAEHLRNEDEYIQIKEDWKFVAMVIDRLQLYIFFFVTVLGTMSILLDAPHIFEQINQDEVIRAHSGVS